MQKPIENLISEILELPIAEINDELEYQSAMNWDSLRHFKLMHSIEHTYGVEIDPQQIIELTSVAKIKKYINQMPAPVFPENNSSSSTTKNTSRSIIDCCEKDINSKKGNKKRDYIYRGLNGVHFDTSSITHIDGNSGLLYFRGYSISELVEKSCFEEVSHLLIYGKLPNIQELENFNMILKFSRDIPDKIVDLIYDIKDSHPMDVLRTAVSALSSFDSHYGKSSTENTLLRGIQLIAKIPTLIATHHSLRQGKQPVKPNYKLNHAANFLYMINGVEPNKDTTAIINKDLIIHADHGSCASTFVARIATSTCADIYSAISGAIGTFSGALHGGAVENVLKMVKEIGEPQNAKQYVNKLRKDNKPIMGFGHRVYRTIDPRATELYKLVVEANCGKSMSKYMEIMEGVAKEMGVYSKYGLNINVDYYSSILYRLLELPDDLAIPIFVISRVSGWVAQIVEQQSNNILIRPLLKYNGEVNKNFVVLEER